MRSAAEAVAYSRRYTSYRSQYCLNFVQTMFAAPWSGPSAIWAWNNAKGRHGPDPSPPAGVPVFWTGGQYGHIAISVGGGRCRSTDWPRAGRAGQTAPVAEAGIQEIARAWGRTYAGWAEYLGGVKIPGIGAGGTPAPSPSGWKNNAVYVNKLREGTRDSDSVWNLQRRLMQLGFAIPAGPTGNWPVNGQTTRALAAWQRSKSQPAPYNTGKSCGPKQTAAMFAGTGIRIFP